eukprot:9223110-Karenia_brevis.AAC.1
MRATGRGRAKGKAQGKAKAKAKAKGKASTRANRPAAEGVCAPITEPDPFQVEDGEETITITLHGQGKENEFARFVVRPGISAARLAQRVSGMIGVPVHDFNLLNLDSPMYLHGGMRLHRDTRVAVQPRLRGG